jgi:hypothetical protein
MIAAYIRESDGERVVDTSTIATSLGTTPIWVFHTVDVMLKVKMKEWETVTRAKKGTTRVFELPSKAYTELCKARPALCNCEITEAYAAGASKSFREKMEEVSRSIVEHMYDDCPVELERKRREVK